MLLLVHLYGNIAIFVKSGARIPIPPVSVFIVIDYERLIGSLIMNRWTVLLSLIILGRGSIRSMLHVRLLVIVLTTQQFLEVGHRRRFLAVIFRVEAGAER